MLKYFLYLLVAIILVSLAAGGVHLYKVAQRNQREMKPYEGEVVKVDKKFGKVLVVYYSLTGHTKDIARRIQKFTGADTYEIKTAEKINAWPWFYLNVKGQLKSGNYPVLAGEMPDFEKYDLIFWGAPVWWYTIATPGLAFLEQADFGGKKVVPFSTQGSNYGTFFEDFSQRAKNAKLQQSAAFNNLPARYDAAVDNKIAVWLNAL